MVNLEMAAFLALYGLIGFVHIALNVRDFKRNPDKKARYQRLPWRYKLTCWGVVMPLFAAACFYWYMFVAAILAYVLLEIGVVRWYRQHLWNRETPSA